MRLKKLVEIEPETSSGIDNKGIYKTHHAITIAPSQGSRITLLERRFFNALLRIAQKQAIDTDIYKVPVQKVLSDYGSQNIEFAIESLRNLARTSVELSVVKENNEGVIIERRWGVTTLIAYVEIKDDDGTLCIEWSYSPQFRKILLDPDRYTKLSSDVVSSLEHIEEMMDKIMGPR